MKHGLPIGHHSWHGSKPRTVRPPSLTFPKKVQWNVSPPALVSDIDKYGAWLTGGGSLLKQLDRKIAEELGIPINMTEDPLSTVVVGSGICLERFDDYNSVLKSSPKPN